MPTIRFEGHAITLAPDETVLDALLRHGVKAPFSCKAGTCQSCLMRVVEGTAPVSSQSGLKESLKSRGFFLPCVCKPENDLTITAPSEMEGATDATVVGTHALSHDVVRVLLKTESPIDYRAGQFVNLIRADGLTRSYSVASLHHRDEHLELHVRRIPDGRMSNWFHSEVRPGDRLRVRGPAGDCFYLPNDPDQNLLLVGTGTGLAPLYGIIQDALHHQHRGKIALFQGALDPSGLYLTEELAALARQHPQLQYHRCIMRGDETDGIHVGAIDQILLKNHPKLAGWRVFLCGNPDLVKMLRKKVFLAGAAMKDIYSDAFIMSAPAAAK